MSNLAAAVHRLAQAVEPPSVPAVDTQHWNKAARLPVLVWGIPGFAALWETRVPETYLDWSGDLVVVRCPCGCSPEVSEGRVVFCAGECGRWFLRVGDGVRVKRWEQNENV